MMEALWNPPNKHALPTLQETEVVKESISALESQLDDAIAIFEQAQSNLEALKQQIRDRKAWISAVRRIPHDVLSLIFLDVCDFNRSAPLFLGHVCRVWRESIHATPRAWTHIPVHKVKNKDLISFFLDRSKHVPLRIGIAAATEVDSWEHLVHTGAMRRTKELAVSLPYHLKVLQQPLPILERLSLSHYRPLAALFNDRPVELSNCDLSFFFNALHFPHLRSLEVEIPLNSTSWTSGPFPIVPLQVLTIESPDPAIWTAVVIGCSQSLKTLVVTLKNNREGNNIVQVERKVVEFPCLERLSINDETYQSTSAWVIDAATPKLQWYKESSRSYKGLDPIHTDTATVMFVSISSKTDLAAYPGVQQLHGTGAILRWAAETLASNRELCPKLVTLVHPLWDSPKAGELSHHLAVRNSMRGSELRVTVGDWRPASIQGELTDSSYCAKAHWMFLRKRGSRFR